MRSRARWTRKPRTDLPLALAVALGHILSDASTQFRESVAARLDGMITAGATLLFGLLCAASLLFALRSRERYTPLWLVAVAAALACGLSLGSLLQDGRLVTRIEALKLETEQLERDNAALSEQLGGGGRTEPADVSPNTSVPETLSAPLVAGRDLPSGPLEPANDLAPDLAQRTSSLDRAGGSASSLPVALSGRWRVRTTIEETTYPNFSGAELIFEIDLIQTGERFQAEGTKFGERLAGDAAVREYPPGSRTPIRLAGEFLGERQVQVTFEESGAVRSSEGSMLLTVVSPTQLEGSFSSSAAGSAGRVVFEKLPLSEASGF